MGRGPRFQLAEYTNSDFDRGTSVFKEIVWLSVSGIFVESWLPGSSWRCLVLRLFGANIGAGVNIKPGVKVKFPWRLSVGHDCWIGEGVWIDNLDFVSIGHDVCISQGAYLCTGSHDWASEDFQLITKPIVVEDHVWIASQVCIAPGAKLNTGVVVGMGALVRGEIESDHLCLADSRAPTMKKK